MAKRYQVIIVGGGPVGVASPSISACAAFRVRAGRAARRAREYSEGPEPHAAHARAFLFLGLRRRAARRAHHAAGLSDQRHHRLRQPDERLLVRAAAARDRAPILFPGCRAPAAISRRRRCCARGWRRCPNVESALRLVGADDRAGRERRARHDQPSKAAAGARCWRRITSSAATARARLVREQIGIERGGADFDQLMVLAVFRSRELHEGLKRFPGALDLQRAASRI